tara:strand:+ start:991 stop:1443 length:453 start_codon:yes stop_codon:yes gene_type:complete
MKKLPNIPSELIRVALADLGEVEEDHRYIVSMDDYYHQNTDWEFPGTCTVCFAGAVMARTLNWPFHVNAVPQDFGEDRLALKALDELRRGEVLQTVLLLSDPDKDTFSDSYDQLKSHNLVCVEVTPHKDDPGAFRDDMNQLADRLEAIGL